MVFQNFPISSISTRIPAIALGGALLASTRLFSIPVAAALDAEAAAAIELLIDFVSESGMLFVRNFGKHD